MDFKLSMLLVHDDITIQCHNVPDADTVSAAYGLYRYFKRHDKAVRIIYAGPSPITKANMLLMLKFMSDVEVEYVDDSYICTELLITVDCQYGASNVDVIDSQYVAIIDHHQIDRNKRDVDYECILSSYGSCASVVYQLLVNEQFSINHDDEDNILPSILYYGLYMDTSEFSELRHPADKDARDDLKVNNDIFIALQNNNLSISEMKIIGESLSSCNYDQKSKFAVIESPNCDPNILGVVSDFVIRVAGIETCVIFFISEDSNKAKLSIRSLPKEVRASDLARELTSQIGSGGGHTHKAGGYIDMDEFRKLYGDLSLLDYLKKRYEEFLNACDLVYYNNLVRTDDFSLYSKRRLVTGYVPTLEIATEGTELIIRTFEGDVTVQASDDCFIMIGIEGEPYPITRAKFCNKYDTDIPIDAPLDIHAQQYLNKITNLTTYERFTITNDVMLRCRARSYRVYARVLTRPTKVFTKWKYDSYMFGDVGDVLAIVENDPQDIYIIKKELFNRTYVKVPVQKFVD